jgi:hypothetical protein
LPDGQRTPAKVKVFSITGGLLSLLKPLAQGSLVRVMFVTHAGPVLGGAEMLSPVGEVLQPFRFVSLPDEDQRKLGAIVQSSLGNSTAIEEDWMEKLRTARSRPTARGFKGFCRRLLPK